MLKFFRGKITSTVMLGVLFIAVVAIVVTGFGTGGAGGIGSGGGGNRADDPALLTTDDGRVGTKDLQRMIDQALQEAQARNPDLTMASFLAQGPFEAFLGQLSVREAMYSFGLDQGLVVSDRMIDDVIASIPAFRSFAGQFDQNTFLSMLRERGMTEADFREEVRKAMIQRQLLTPIGLAGHVSDTISHQFASAMNERRQGLVGTIPLEALAAGVAPTDAEIAQYYSANRTRYALPERRVIRYAVLGREQLGDAVRATDAEIEANFRQNAARYAGTETRQIQQVPFQTEAEARAFAARVQGGTPFAQAAGANLIDLGPQTREQFTSAASPELAAAAFAAAENATVGPMQTPYGWRVVRVGTITRTAARPLAAVRTEIATQIEQGKVQEALRALTGRIEDKIADGGSFEDIARAERLTVVETPAVTETGQAPGTNWRAPAEMAPLLRSAFMIDADAPEPAIEALVPNQRYAFIGLARVVPPGVQPLQQVRDQVRADVVRTRAGERARALVQRIVQRVNGGASLTQAFAEAGVRLPAPRPIDARRDDLFNPQRRTSALLAFFGTRPGRAREVQDPNGRAWYVVQVQRRLPEAVACAPAERNSPRPTRGCELIRQSERLFRESTNSEYGDQFARAVERSAPVQRNEEAIRALRQQLATSGR